MRQRNSLTFELSVVLLLITTSVFAVFAAYRYDQDSAALREEMNAALEQSASSLASGLSSPFFTYYEEGIRDVILSEMQDPTLVGVYLFDEGATAPRYGYARVGNELSASTEVVSSPETIRFSRPIINREETLGRVLVIKTTKAMQAQLRDAVNSSIAQAIVLDLVLILLVITFIRLRFIQPILQLTEVTAAIADGDIEQPVNVKASAEIAQLATSFAKMRNAIRTQIVDLENENAECKRVEGALRESEGRLQAIMDNTSTPIYLKDLEGRLLMVNRRTMELLGITKLSNQTTADFYSKESAAMLEANDRAALERGAAMEFEEQLPTEDGFRTYISVKFPLLDADGIAYGVGGISTDISERKRAEQERLALEKQLTQTQKLESLGVLAGGIAHDFNNLLMAVMGNSELVLTKLPADSAVREEVEDIFQAATRAAELANQMLAYTGQGKFVVEAIDLSAAVKGMVVLLDASKSKNVTLDLNLATDLRPVIADTTQLRQIIMNLVTNASEALDEQPGEVSVTTSMRHCTVDFLASTYVDDNLPAADYICLEVADTGCGMDEETQAKAFDPFFTTKFAGRGLGLAALLGIIRGHKGAIQLQSSPGAGTRMSVFFPAADVSAAPRTMHEKPTEDWRGSGTILLVDDEQSVLDIGAKLIASLGFEVITAHDGIEALATYTQHSDNISAVLLDMTMPRMDGEETFRALLAQDPDARVIICSGYTEDKVTASLVDKGLSGFIQKPYSRSTLREALRKALEGVSINAVR